MPIIGAKPFGNSPSFDYSSNMQNKTKHEKIGLASFSTESESPMILTIKNVK